MKRTKESDWTRVLQERLQDAELPVADDFASWAGQNPPAFPARSHQKQGDRPENHGRFWPVVWWPWVLAGVVAVIAAVLVLRPVADPVHEPDRLAETSPAPIADLTDEAPATESSSGIDPELSEPADGVFQTGGPELFFGSRKTNSGSANPSADPSSPSFAGLTDESPSSNPAPSEDGTPKTTTPSSKQTPNEDKISDQGLNDGWEFLDEPTRRSRRAKRGRVALRIHAASVSSVNTASAIGVPYNGTNQFSDAVTDQSAPEFYFGNVADGGLATSTLDNGQLFPVKAQNTGLFPNYMSDYASNIINPVAVPRAPTIPISIGVSAELSLSRHWSLLAGLDYTQRSGYHVLDNTPQSLTLHYLGIPLEAHYVFWPECRFRVYLGVGVKAEKSFLVTGGEPLKDPFLFSVNAQAGADVRIFPGIRLYFSPVFSGYLTHSAYANTWDSRPQFSLRAGLSFDL